MDIRNEIKSYVVRDERTVAEMIEPAEVLGCEIMRQKKGVRKS